MLSNLTPSLNKRVSYSTVFLYFRSVQFNEEVEVKTLIEGVAGSNPSPSQVVEISEEKIDYVMHLLHEADPVSYDVLMTRLADISIIQIGRY